MAAISSAPSTARPVAAEFEALAKKIFQAFDYDGDGKVTAAEAVKFCRQMVSSDSDAEEAAKLMLKDIDINKDGGISFEEFYGYLLSKCDGGVASDDDLDRLVSQFPLV